MKRIKYSIHPIWLWLENYLITASKLTMEASNVTRKEDISVPLVSKSSAKPYYVKVCEETEGRTTPPNCDVHHINGDHKDNRPENLIIVPDSMHNWLHNGAKITNPWMSTINWREFRKELE